MSPVRPSITNSSTVVVLCRVSSKVITRRTTFDNLVNANTTKFGWNMCGLLFSAEIPQYL